MQIVLAELYRGGDAGDGAAFAPARAAFCRSHPSSSTERIGPIEHRPTRPKLSALRVFVASDGRNADAERHDERHGHRPGRHAAGVERDGEDALIRQKRRGKDDARKIRSASVRSEMPKRECAPCTASERSRRRPKRSEINTVVSISGTLPASTCKSGSATVMATPSGEAHRQDQPQLARFRQLGAHVVADAGSSTCPRPA